MLQITGLRKVYGKNVVLDDLDLSAERALLHRADRRVRLGQVDVAALHRPARGRRRRRHRTRRPDITDPRVDANAVRTKIGIVFQAYNLFPHLRVIDNVTLGPRRVHKMTREQAEAEALAMLERVGLRDKANARPDELSGGQQQRVAIARALVDQAAADAVRRGDERARPRAGRRGARA